MGWMVQGLNPCGSKKVFSSSKNPHQLCGPPSIIFNRYLGSFLDVHQLGCEVNNSPPPTTEINNEWSYTSAAPIHLHGVNTETLPFTFTVMECFFRS